MPNKKMQELPRITTVVSSTDTIPFVKNADTAPEDHSILISDFMSHVETDPIVKAINGIVKSNGSMISAASDGTDFLSPITGVTISQATGQTIGSTGARLSKLWVADIEVTNAISGSVTGNAGTVNNATLTTALAVDNGTVTLHGNVANTSAVTIGAGAVAISGNNTGDGSTSVTGILKGNGSAISAAVSGTDLKTVGGVSIIGSGDITVGGPGTVTAVSVTTANGVSGSVATATTTPAISLTLGAITPTSVNSVTISGSSTPTLAVTGTTTVSGTNTGDQNISNFTTAPATNTADYIPQWNGANSKTLKDGLAVPAGGLAGITALNTKMPMISLVSVKTTTYAANAFEFVPCDVSAAGFTVTLPSAPTDGTMVIVKVSVVGPSHILTLACGGTDHFTTPTGNTSLYMQLAGETNQVQYNSALGVWYIIATAAPSNFAIGFPGIDATTPITNTNISIDTSTRVLTITPPLGYFNIYVDGGGVITRFRKTGTINFPAFTDTSGMWYFYFNNAGVATATQTPWTTADFSSIALVYRILWNSTLVGAAKAVSEYIEYHLNDISSDDHQWFHLQGTQWINGFSIASNTLAAGNPATNGSNTCISLTTGSCVDDNLEYTITNDTSGTAFHQDMGNTTPASLTNANAGLFQPRYQDGSGNQFTLAATRFPFTYSAGNVIEYINATGTRTAVPDGDFAVWYVFTTQNPRTGEAVKVISAPTVFTSQANAEASNWVDILGAYPVLGSDPEIRPLFRLIYESRGAYNVGCKKAALREVQDLRKAAITSTATATGSLPATSVTFTPTGTITSTNVQSALAELDTLKAPVGQTMYIGTTATTINRASAAQTIAGITLTTPDIGTPSTGTLTSCTGLPIAGLVASTSTAIGVGSIELGHATDTTISRASAGVIAVEGITVDTISATNTLTNKTLTSPKIGTSILDTNGATLATLTATGSAVNYINIANGATTANATITAAGETNTGITITGKGTKGVLFGNAIAKKSFTVSDGAGFVVDCSLGNIAKISAAADRTTGAPTNVQADQLWILRFTASGGARTLTLSSDFTFGSDITALTQTVSGKTDIIGLYYNGTKHEVIAYKKGF